MPKYTFTFPYDSEKIFQGVISRLDEGGYEVIEPVSAIKPDDRYSDKRAVMVMDEESALTFRMRMGNSLKIERDRTEEELKEKKQREERHVVKVRVKVDGLDPNLTK